MFRYCRFAFLVLINHHRASSVCACVFLPANVSSRLYVKSIGGGDDTVKLQKSGGLLTKLTEAGAV